MLHYHPRLVHLGWPDLSLVFRGFQDPDMVETTGQVEIEPITNNHLSAFQKSPSKLCLRKLEFSGETVTEEIITSGVGNHFNFGSGWFFQA